MVHLQRFRGPADELALIEVLLLGQGLADSEVDPRKTLQVIVVQVPVWRGQPINPSSRLGGHFIGILL